MAPFSPATAPMATRVMCSIPPTMTDVGIAHGDFHEADVNAGHGGAALLVHEFGGDGLGKIGQEDRETAAVAPLFTHARWPIPR